MSGKRGRPTIQHECYSPSSMVDASAFRRTAARRSVLWALILAFAVSLPVVTTRLYASDEIEYFAFLRSMWFDHDLSFENEYQYFYDRGIARAWGFHQTFLEERSRTGLRYNFGTIGPALLWAPLYGIADIGVRLARAAGSQVQADGFSRPYLAAVTYGSALYGFLALLISTFVAKRIVGQETAWAAALVWMGTPLAFYMYLAPGMAHACSAFAVSAFVATWLVVRERWSARGLMALGALAALMTVVREQDAFYVAGVAIDFIWGLAVDVDGRSALAKRLRSVLAGVFLFLVCFAPQAWAYLVLNGRIGPASPVTAKMYWTAPHALQVLLSPEHGFFFWTPLAAIGLIGLVVAGASARSSSGAPAQAQTRRIAVALLVMFAAQVYVSGSIDTWTVAGSFGQRRFVGATVVLVTGLALFLRDVVRRRRIAMWIPIVICVWWNVGLMVQFGAGLMDRQRLQLAQNAYNSFAVIPRMLPSLGYRYLFDRASFYHPSVR
jgi:hypothetical protein